MIESGTNDLSGPEDWFCLSRHCTSRELGLTLDILLTLQYDAVHLETDVKFEKTCEPKYY